ncbi:hypothetical protein EJV47_03415 [Hymenobacter gummosus]|uniref:Uncharacterized protein n=1 Tax=Hymenobacter gummosus TaxID=1776032 RepID=A0A3S0H8P7_9BACT|nr:hypothetical protein [Hymenobacter gummosus]RTQ52091.1 hypothetical protein EJV47_03415 [Hymenobacter gummosus]
MVLPYVLVVLIPRTTDGGNILKLNFLALCTLFFTGYMLDKVANRQGRRPYHLVGALAAVVFFFLSESTLRATVDYVSFKFKQNRVEPLALNPHNAQQLTAAGFVRVETAHPGVTLFVEDGAASVKYWGVAYSAADETPNNSYLPHEVCYWQRLSGHWYKWVRYD